MIFENIVKIVVDIKKISDNSALTIESNLIDEFGFDSINIVMLVCRLEEEFDIIITDEELDIDTLSLMNNLVNMVQCKCEERKPSVGN